MIKLKLEKKVIELNTYILDNKTLYKAQDLLKGYGLNVQQTKDSIQNWKDSVTKKCGVKFTPHSIQRGKEAGTYLTKRDTLKLAGYVSHEFEDAVYDAFEDLVNGNTTEAAIKAGSVVFNSELAAKVENDWVEFCKNCHVDFKDVNARYGSNFTKLIVKTISGYSFVNQIDGKPDANLVKRLIEQKHGEAIQALNATLSIANGFLSSGLVQAAMNTRDGKKAVYNDLKAILNQ